MDFDFQSFPRGLRHPEVFVVPALMQIDHSLTVLGAKRRLHKYAQHDRSKDYELNPGFQKSVHALRWINPFHIYVTVVFTAVMCAISEVDPLVLRFFVGSSVGYFGALVGGHMSNLRVFGYLQGHPKEVAGSVEFTRTAQVAIAQATNFRVLIPLLVLTWFVRDAYTFGAVAGVVWLMCVHHRWYRHAEGEGGFRFKSAEPTSAPVTSKGIPPVPATAPEKTPPRSQELPPQAPVSGQAEP